MRVLVTGATSLLGGAVIDRLLERGDTVATLQRRPSRFAEADGVTEALGDITDIDAVAGAVEGCDAVVHLAARVDVIGPWNDYERTNVLGTKLALDAAAEAGVERFVHVSSPSVAHAGEALVGAGAGRAEPEHTRGHYATSKAMAEELALTHGGVPVVAIRPHLVWGPGDSQLVGRIVERARQGRMAIIGSGAALIDSTYLDDAADALVAAVDRTPELIGEALVVSGGQPRPVAELIGRILVAAGLEPPTRRVPVAAARGAGAVVERAWDAFDLAEPPMTTFLAEQLSTAHWFDQRRTRELLGWEPQVGIDDGLRRLAAWYAEDAG
ncbi:MAG: NAD-dependent epimerase/dehydratase family protein [Actinomycetota bacterium]